jgi:CRISPR-associated endonuclease/helicase Cas3
MTWRWLKEGERDFGIESMRSALAGLSGEDLGALLSPRTRAPVMLPAHLDAWAQTSPVPRPDPDIALWLHGVGRRQAPEVQIVWRGDLGEALLEAARSHEEPAVRARALEAILARVELCPPVGLEAIAVPLHAARAWLRGEEAPAIADVAEDARTEKERERDAERRDREGGRPALLWRGEESRVIGAGDDIEPGSTLVVPGAYGGMARSSWDPSAKDPVLDVGDRARFLQTGRPVLRLHPSVVSDARWARAPAAADSDDPVQEHRDLVVAVLDEMVAEQGSQAAASLRRSRKREIVPIEPIDIPGADGADHVEPGYLAVVGRAMGRDATTDGDDGSHTGVEVPLREHLAGVERWAARFADRCGLSPRIARSVALAGAFHDAGKVDPRFQRMLRGGGDSWMALAEPLAKSKTVAANRVARRRAQERSGYPKGTRHELGSVALLEQAPSLLGGDVDRDLVLFLIASHHGFCRPLAPVAEADTDPVELCFDVGGAMLRASSDHGLARLDAGVPDRFWLLLDRYGWFGLAWLEALVRLADHRRSEEEQA